MSGLRCATVLLEHSYDVTIIEARNRIGGRVGVERSVAHCTRINIPTDCQERSDGTARG